MTLFIAFLLMYQIDASLGTYILAVAVWFLHLSVHSK